MSTSRNTLEEILAQARRLPEDQRQRLVSDLQADQGAGRPSESRRRNAMKRWLGRAGTAHVDVADISSHKNEYLTESLATKP
jgi:hypothetical protein